MSLSKSLTSFSLTLALIVPAVSAQTRVDLMGFQSPIKNQGSRGTCTCFGAIAALEARYRHAGYPYLDLSEEFCNYVGKMNALDPNWSVIYPKGASWRESGVGAFGGGNGYGNLRAFAGGLRIPAETYMPYRNKPYDLGAFKDWKHIWWKVQANVNGFNLDPKRLSRRALTAPRYYEATGYKQINANSVAEIEAALQKGFEVVWDFHVRGTQTSKTIWRTGTTSKGGHSMLIVGYDRSNKDKTKHYFICKNSWGKSGAMANGFTHIEYPYIANGYSAAYITGVKAPRAWPELAFIGRRNLAFDGHRGTLDIYHIPGTAQWHFDENKLKVIDRRIGSFRGADGKMRRVNGEMLGNLLVFWMRSKYPNMGYGDRSESPALCQKFTYHMLDVRTGEIAGWHQDNAGTTPKPAWGGYARIPSTLTGTDGFLNPTFDIKQAKRPEQFYGLWNCEIDRRAGQISVQYRDDSALSAAARVNFYGLHCEYIDSVTSIRRSFTATVSKSRTAEIRMNFSHPFLGYVQMKGFMLSWQRGVFAGDVKIGTSVFSSFYAYRTGSQTTPGASTIIGIGCTGTNGKLIHTVTPAPFVGKTSGIACTGGPRSGSGLWVLGPFKLMLYPGTKSCFLRVDPLVFIPAGFSSTGLFRANIKVANDRSLIGGSIYSQVAGFDPKANVAGITLSNAVYLRVGGYK